MADGVADEEILYRSVRQDQYQSEGGIIRLHSTAFADRSQRISFDRATLRTADEARKDSSQAVFAVTAKEVRGIKDVVINETVYRVDVIASPLADNPAHAHVEAFRPQRNRPRIKPNWFQETPTRPHENSCSRFASCHALKRTGWRSSVNNR